MAHSHYVMDLYYDDGEPNTLRREVLRITAVDDAEAVGEATRISSWRQPVRYDVRAMTKAARANHRLVYASVAEPAIEDDVQPEVSGEGVPDTEPLPLWDRFK